MSVGIPGRYPDPERPGEFRDWDGQEWAPRPSPQSRVSRVLAKLAIAAAATGPAAVVSTLMLALMLLGFAYVLGAPQPEYGLIYAFVDAGATGALFGSPFVVIGLVLAVLATTRPVRATTHVRRAWIAVGIGLFVVSFFLALGRPLWI